MTLAHHDACSWAHARSKSEVPRLGMLEAMAFQAHPEVVATFGEDGAAVAALLQHSPDTAPRRTGRGLLLVVGALAILSPVAGMAVLGAESYLIDRVSAPVSVPVASGAFWVGAAMLLFALLAWIRTGAYWSGMLCGIGVVSAISAIFATISMPRVSERDGYELSIMSVAPVWVTLVLSVILVLALLARFRVREEQPVRDLRAPRLTVSDRSAAIAVASAVSAAERDGIRADRDAALRILDERDLIDADLLERALVADLGTLFTLDAPRGISA